MVCKIFFFSFRYFGMVFRGLYLWYFLDVCGGVFKFLGLRIVVWNFLFFVFRGLGFIWLRFIFLFLKGLEGVSNGF